MSKFSEWIQAYADSKRPGYPTVYYPTIIDGFISGNSVRCESLDGGEMFLTGDLVSQIKPAGANFNVGLIHFGDCGIELTNFGPFVYNGKTWGVTHLQKQSKKGFLDVGPDCYHKWTWWKLQEKDKDGNWISGSERGIYYRKPLSWRWDVVGTPIDGVLQHWIWTKGYLGGHWD